VIWRRVTPRLAAHRLVVAPDLPGLGQSPPADPVFDLDTVAETLGNDLAEQVGNRPFDLVGNSLGGAVAMQVAVQSPHRVASLVLVDSAGFGREVTLALRLLGIRPLGRLLLRPSRWGARLAEQSIFHDPSFATDERVGRAERLARRPHAADAMLDTARGLGTLRGVRPEWRSRLLEAVAGLDIPILVVWGSEDRILPAAHLAAAAARLPRARTHLFEDTGHMPQIERAEAFSRLVTAFWESLDREGLRTPPTAAG
jgi:pimeloyl-ACP methyl ester carboxylesterase